MVIDKIGNVGKIFRAEKNEAPKAKAGGSKGGSDTVSISAEALKAAENAKAQDTVSKASDVRQDRVKEVKAKLERGDYDNIDHEILDRVAEKIARNLAR